MEKRGTMAVKEGHIERERWEERARKGKKKTSFEISSGTSRLEGNGQGDCIRDHTHTDTHKYFEPFQGALMKLSR